MIGIFIAAAVFGCAFLIPMILGGLSSEFGADLGDGGFDADVGADLDMDMDLDLDPEFDVGSEFDVGDSTGELVAEGTTDGVFGETLGSIFSSVVSFRTVVFFSAFFGTSGLVLSAFSYSNATTLITAIGIGAMAATINSVLFGLIRTSEPNSQISDRTLEGRWAKVVLPMSGSQRGRIRIDLSGQPQYMVARPIDDGSDQRFDVGASVVVVKIELGTALVASLAELDTGEES